MGTIFGDYVAGFLGLGRDGCTWSMNPFDVSLSAKQHSPCGIERTLFAAHQDQGW